MCDFDATNKAKDLKSFTGYKIVMDVDGKYESPATRIQYKKGYISPITSTSVPNRHPYFMDVLNPVESYAYDSDYRKYTAIFKEYKHAACVLDCMANRYNWAHMVSTERVMNALNYPLKIVKMTITTKLKSGTYVRFPIIAGKRIVQIEEL